MKSYKELYLHLFNATEEAMRLLENQEVVNAYVRLNKAQQEAEAEIMKQDSIPEQ